MRTLRHWPVLAGMLVGALCADFASAQTNNGSVLLQWTAPGDDSLTGTASRYDLRYSLFPITESNFEFCWAPSGLPRPVAAGSVQSFTMQGLISGVRYYFALKTADERLNWSPISNVIAIAQSPVGVGDGTIAEAEFGSPFPNPARFETSFRYALPVAGRVAVDLYDVQGRAVRHLIDQPMPAGSGVVRWDLRDMYGQRVPIGAYLARAWVGEHEIRRRVVVTY